MAEEQTSPSFQGVPVEIRMLVYDFLLGDRVCWVNFPKDKTVRSGIIGALAILRVSKQVHAEARRVLRVRTLRINKFDIVDFPLLPRIPLLILKYSNMIEKLLIGFQTREFGWLTGQTEGLSYEPQLLTSVQEIIACLPKLQSVVLTCDDVSWLGTHEEWTTRLAQVLKETLRKFDHVTATVKDPPRWSQTGSQAEVKFLKRTDRGKKWEESDYAKSKGTKVLLDVINSRNSHSVRWLTVDEVNE